MGKNRIRILLISGFGILLLSSHLYAAVSRKNVLWLSPYGNAVVYNLDFKLDKYIITPGQPWKHFNVGYDKVDGKMKITVYSKTDIKKNGQLKVKNNSKEMTKEEFTNYVIDNNLIMSKGYIDLIGYLSNEKMFKCSYQGMVIGVTGIMDEVREA